MDVKGKFRQVAPSAIAVEAIRREHMKKTTVNGQLAKKGKNFLRATRGERWEFVSPSNRHLSGKFVSRFWHSGTEFLIFKAR